MAVASVGPMKAAWKDPSFSLFILDLLLTVWFCFHCRLSQNLFLVTKVTQAFILFTPTFLLLVVCILRLEEQEKFCHGR